MCIIPSVQSLFLNCWACAIYKWSVASTENQRRENTGQGMCAGRQLHRALHVPGKLAPLFCQVYACLGMCVLSTCFLAYHPISSARLSHVAVYLLLRRLGRYRWVLCGCCQLMVSLAANESANEKRRKKKKRASTHSNDPTYHSLAGQQFCLQAEKQPFPHSCTGRNLLVVIPLGVSQDVGSTTCFCTAHWHCWLLKSCEYKEWCCLAKSPANCSQEEDASCFSESGGVPLWMCQSSGLGGRIHWFTKFVSGRSSW